jgi:hypothetical protein
MLASIVLLMLAAAPLGLLARREPRTLIGWGLALIPLAGFIALSTQIGAIVDGGRLEETLAWAPSLGLELRFTLDGLSLLFALIITGIGTLIIGYGGAYMEKDSGLGRFYVYLILFMGAMLGLVLAGNVLTMFVFWELTSVTSYLLIGYKHDYPDARRGAQHSLLVTGGGGLALLVGLLLLGYMTQQTGVAGSEAYTFAAIIAAGDALKESALYTPALILVFLGCFTKSAQFPFHFWLPGAMQAPTPASAFLHSATMVKAGVYLLARLAPGLGGTLLWDLTLILVGGFTFAFGAVVAVRQFDIKALLAYTTLSMLGGLVMLIGLGGKYSADDEYPGACALQVGAVYDGRHYRPRNRHARSEPAGRAAQIYAHHDGDRRRGAALTDGHSDPARFCGQGMDAEGGARKRRGGALADDRADRDYRRRPGVYCGGVAVVQQSLPRRAASGRPAAPRGGSEAGDVDQPGCAGGVVADSAAGPVAGRQRLTEPRIFGGVRRAVQL